jgi:hypothetical protein
VSDNARGWHFWASSSGARRVDAIVTRAAVASQLVGDDRPRHILQPLQQSPKKMLGAWGIAPIPDEDVEHNVILTTARHR